MLKLLKGSTTLKYLEILFLRFKCLQLVEMYKICNLCNFGQVTYFANLHRSHIFTFLNLLLQNRTITTVIL